MIELFPSSNFIHIICSDYDQLLRKWFDGCFRMHRHDHKRVCFLGAIFARFTSKNCFAVNKNIRLINKMSDRDPGFLLNPSYCLVPSGSSDHQFHVPPVEVIKQLNAVNERMWTLVDTRITRMTRDRCNSGSV